eukprot:ANDGO_05399.mRNA.1 hypothetical protein
MAASWATYAEFIRKDAVPAVQDDRQHSRQRADSGSSTVSKAEYESFVRTRRREYTDPRYTGNRECPTYANSTLMRSDHISFTHNADKERRTLSVGKSRFSSNVTTESWAPKSSALQSNKAVAIYDPVLDCEKIITIKDGQPMTSTRSNLPVSFGSTTAGKAKTCDDVESALQSRVTFNRRKGVAEINDLSSPFALRTTIQHKVAMESSPKAFFRKKTNLGT